MGTVSVSLPLDTEVWNCDFISKRRQRKKSHERNTCQKIRPDPRPTQLTEIRKPCHSTFI